MIEYYMITLKDGWTDIVFKKKVHRSEVEKTVKQLVETNMIFDNEVVLSVQGVLPNG